MDIEQLLNDIADSNFSKNIIIDINHVINLDKYHDTLVIQVFNNEIFTKRPVTEERHHQVLKQLKRASNNLTLPNCIFAYSTRDDYPDKNDHIFTHAKLNNSLTNNILAPCFTFDSYPEKIPSNFIKYENSYSDLIHIGNKYIQDFNNWNSKENAFVFIGSIHTNNYRDVNTQIKSSNVPIIIQNLDAASGERFISRTELGKYKYLLHLNGNGGAYASRLKYLLFTGSLVFYITNFRNNNHEQIEYWMNTEHFKSCIVLCNNTSDCNEKLDYFYNNITEAFNIAKKGYEYTFEILKPENVDKYWQKLLTSYNIKVKNYNNILIFSNKY
jgi:hypothetical protein